MTRNLHSVLAGSAAGALLLTGSLFGVAAPASASQAMVLATAGAPPVSEAATSTVRSHLVRQKKASGCSIILNHDLKRLKRKYYKVWVTQNCKWVKKPGYVGYYEARMSYDTRGTIA